MTPAAVHTRGKLGLTTMMVRFPLISLAVTLVPAVWLAVLGLRHEISFDVGVDSFQITKAHFSQQREQVLSQAIHEENSYPSYDRRRRMQSHFRVPSSHANQAAPGAFQERDYTIDRLELIMFYKDQRNILTPEGLSRARAVEQAIEAFPGYEDYCAANPAVFGQHCAPVNSVTSYFFPSAGEENELQYDGRGEEIVDFTGTRDALAAHAPAHWFLSDTDGYRASSLLRAEVTFAADHNLRTAEREQYEAWAQTLVPLLEQQSDDDFVCVYGGKMMTTYLVTQALWSDLDYAICSVALVLLYTWWHTRSLALAIMSLTMISLSFPVAFFFYFTFYATDESNKLGLLNIMGVYVTLGIGVDDVYVFLAAFEQCADSSTLEVQLGRAYRRAGKAMLTTSATTALAFCANMVSSIPVILSFSAYMATLVVINYVFIITIFPGATH